MIEFLPPRHDAFGESDVADFVGVDGDGADGFDDDRPPTPRWLAVVAGVAVTALLAGGIVAASPWSGDEAAPPTTVPPTTAPVPVTTPTDDTDTDTDASSPLTDDGVVVRGGNPGWLVDDEASDFRLWAAASNTAAFGEGDAFELWLTEGATRTSGRWLSIDAVPFGTPALRRSGTLIDVVRADGSVRAGLVSTADDGVTEVVVRTPDELDTTFVLTSFGLSLDQVLAVARSVDVSLSAVTTPPELAAPGGVLDGMVTAFDGRSDWYPESFTAAPVLAWSVFADPTFQWVQVEVSALRMPSMLIEEYLLRSPIDEQTLRRRERGRLVELRRDGRDVQLFRTATDQRVVGGWWYDGDGRRVTAIGRVSVEELIDLIGRLQPADAAAWDDALQQQQDTGSPPAPVEIGGTPTGDWSAQVGNGWFWVSSLDEFANHSWDPTPGRSVEIWAGFEQQYVLITDTTGQSRSAQVVYSDDASGTGDVVDEPAMVVLDDGTTAAVVRTDAATTVTVHFLDEAGTVLTDWTSG